MEEKAARDSKELTDRFKIMTEKLGSLKSFEQEKESLERDISHFESEIRNVKNRKQEILSTKEREKILRNHESKIEMAVKLEEAKNSLEKMKKKEIEVNAKLTILQNYQLSLELEAFSEKINAMLKENVRLQDFIERKNREIDIQKSSEIDFAEQENIKKRMILRLTGRSKELEEEIEELEDKCRSSGIELEIDKSLELSEGHSNYGLRTSHDFKKDKKVQGKKEQLPFKCPVRSARNDERKSEVELRDQCNSVKDLKMVS